MNTSVCKDLKFLLQVPLGMALQTNIVISMHPGLLASSLQNMAPGTEELRQLYLQRGDFTHGEEERLLQCSPAVTPLWRKAHS